jgi:hypothetical protein
MDRNETSQTVMIDPSSVHAYFPELCYFELLPCHAHLKVASMYADSDNKSDLDVGDVGGQLQRRNQLRFVEGRLQAVGFLCEFSNSSHLGSSKGLSRSRQTLWGKVLYFMTK